MHAVKVATKDCQNWPLSNISGTAYAIVTKFYVLRDQTAMHITFVMSWIYLHVCTYAPLFGIFFGDFGFDFGWTYFAEISCVCVVCHLKNEVLFFGGALGFSHDLVHLMPIGTILGKTDQYQSAAWVLKFSCFGPYVNIGGK